MGRSGATGQPASRLCCACFDGRYPIELPSTNELGKNVMENMLAAVQADNDNVSALSRP